MKNNDSPKKTNRFTYCNGFRDIQWWVRRPSLVVNTFDHFTTIGIGVKSTLAFQSRRISHADFLSPKIRFALRHWWKPWCVHWNGSDGSFHFNVRRQFSIAAVQTYYMGRPLGERLTNFSDKITRFSDDFNRRSLCLARIKKGRGIWTKNIST